MKQLNLKKLVLLNLPYFLLGLFATNLGEAWRLAVGADASAKMLSFFSTLPVALGSWWPSLHPLDLAVGLCCGAGLRLAVYLKGKNAKKYRHNVEYGSARWGTHEDIAPYIDPVFQNNVILTQTERLTMSSRPKNPNIRLGKWGRMRREYLRQAHPIVFSEMVLSETLYEHCAEIEATAKKRMDVILPQLMKYYGVTEQLKAENQIEWVRQMNACVAQAEETIKGELIYCE